MAQNWLEVVSSNSKSHILSHTVWSWLVVRALGSSVFHTEPQAEASNATC